MLSLLCDSGAPLYTAPKTSRERPSYRYELRKDPPLASDMPQECLHELCEGKAVHQRALLAELWASDAARRGAAKVLGGWRCNESTKDGRSGVPPRSSCGRGSGDLTAETEHGASN